MDERQTFLTNYRKEEAMSVGESIQLAGLVYLILAIIGFGVAGMITMMSKLFSPQKK